MAIYYGVSDPETVKVWCRDVWREFRKSDALFRPENGFVGKNPRKYPIVVRDELEKTPGDRVRSVYLQQLTGRGEIGDATFEGKEESTVTSTHDLVIEEQIHGVKTRGVMSEQRVTFDTFEEAKNLLTPWWRDRRAVSVINHLCAYTAQTDLAYTALNTVAAIDNEHIYRVNSGLGAAADETVAADNTALFDLEIIDELVCIAEQMDPPIAPVEIDGNAFYIMLVHPNVATDLRKSSSEWYATMQNAIRGGALGDNPLFRRAMGIWRDTLIISEPHITRGVHSSTGLSVNSARRNVFMGAGAVQIAYGRRERGKPEHMTWYSSTWDHGRKFYASAGMCWGAKALSYAHNGTVRATGRIVVTSYSAERYGTGRDLHQPNLD